MNIKNIGGLTVSELQREINSGGKFVEYNYAVSIIVMTLKKTSDIYFVRSDENAVTQGLVYSLISLFVGWWGIPWGPVYTIGSFIINFGGGRDVTDEVMASLAARDLLSEMPMTVNA